MISPGIPRGAGGSRASWPSAGISEVHGCEGSRRPGACGRPRDPSLSSRLPLDGNGLEDGRLTRETSCVELQKDGGAPCASSEARYACGVVASDPRYVASRTASSGYAPASVHPARFISSRRKLILCSIRDRGPGIWNSLGFEDRGSFVATTVLGRNRPARALISSSYKLFNHIANLLEQPDSFCAKTQPMRDRC